MIRKNFNENWKMTKGSSGLVESLTSGSKSEVEVMLPHDAMIHEQPTPDTKNGSQTGYYPGNNYTYTKKFAVPANWKDKKVMFEFEGIYMNSFVYINGEYVINHPFGYGNFYADADDFLKYGEENKIKVMVKTGSGLNSRWYSGAGIYRNVKIMVSDKLHIKPDGVKITTPDIEEDSASVVVTTEIENLGYGRSKVSVVTELRGTNNEVVGFDSSPLTAYEGTTNIIRQRIAVVKPALWDCDHPNLYNCTVKIILDSNVIDEAAETFGIRKLQLDALHGLRINGKAVNLRGACIHHDNGVIGAATFERAEERRCQQLKAAGFNCLRSSHQPMSKAMLEACDREGMLVMDELFDMWHIPKNDYDFALNFEDWWKRETEAMVIKDFNHPCVILYSMGNEIQEIGTAKGAQMNRRIADVIKSLDTTRYTTAAINGMMAITDDMPIIMGDIMQQLGISMPTMGDSAADGGADSEMGGFNNMLALVAGPLGDLMCSHPITSQKTEEFYTGMDVCGMNYMPGRYEKDHELYPNRIIIGSESYPTEIVRLWGLVEKHPHVIGDMTWTGYDYLGEAGIGVTFYDNRQNFGNNWPCRVSYSGDIDIIGNRRPISYLREIVYGLRKEPYIAVEKVNHYEEKPVQTPWAYKDCLESWTWSGYEGKPAIVNVFSVSDEVELLLNSKSLGRKPSGKSNGFITTFEITYQSGCLLAVGYSNGKEGGRMELVTADDKLELNVDVDRTIMKADGSDLSYLMISLIDSKGVINRYAKKNVVVSVEGAGVLQGFGSADPLPIANYDELTQSTFEGYALAVVRGRKEQGEITVKISAEGCMEKRVKIKVQ